MNQNAKFIKIKITFSHYDLLKKLVCTKIVDLTVKVNLKIMK